eukprot:185736-Pleurochrysis_carterae.AAC.2
MPTWRRGRMNARVCVACACVKLSTLELSSTRVRRQASTHYVDPAALGLRNLVRDYADPARACAASHRNVFDEPAHMNVRWWSCARRCVFVGVSQEAASRLGAASREAEEALELRDAELERLRTREKVRARPGEVASACVRACTWCVR